MKKLVKYLVAALMLSGCAEIQHASDPEQALDRSLLAGVGDVVVRLNKERNLENAFGKSDIFGRRTNEGYIEVRFAGMEPTGEVVLYRKDVQIITNETTMSRTPVSQTSGRIDTTASGRVTDFGAGATLSGTATTTFRETTTSPASDFHVVVPADTIPIRLAATEITLPVEGYVIEIIRATPNAIEYRLRRQ